MTQQTDHSKTSLPLLSLKAIEPEVDAYYPWRDDILGRREIAEPLTGLVLRREATFVIRIDWAVGRERGKTFLLKRWMQDPLGFDAVVYRSRS